MWAMYQDGRALDDIASCFGVAIDAMPSKIALGERLNDIPTDWDKDIADPKYEPLKRLDNLVVTLHAKQRWDERVPDGIDMLEEYKWAIAVTPKRRRIIAQRCPLNARKYMHDFAGRYYLESRRTNVVFVMQQPAIMITVFCL